ncbi:TPA: DNA cytosine methyltransferase [Proteus mirabilis]|uniref:DNA cytosine methyltransferase n=1 Tax=Morganella morganii TaxID=582 RepID=A0AAI9MSG4_MORMO|nr:DNA cytosine methyltransferase [Klebsiella pneumoniae]EKW8761314.1 DNA cytosine methyltransferase [Morganella morganii]HEJ9424977.1 DNA cytosine methyltransferase [Proteus mirabilis]HEJ9454173.1 DNA cytosine methyltransferase [Proteus mirabilis]HEJ9465805.1 DNA cytosine methyltransferase [Proteus mirabilis]
MSPVLMNSYFCGAGLMDIGLKNAGIQIAQSFELDKDAVKTYRHNLGNHIKHCDITQEMVLEQDSCHGMSFTYPCTKYSTIGDIHGTRTGDELFLHALRHLAVAQPEFYVIENVPGMLAFPIVMETMTKLAGYFIQVFCPVKSELWVSSCNVPLRPICAKWGRTIASVVTSSRSVITL